MALSCLGTAGCSTNHSAAGPPAVLKPASVKADDAVRASLAAIERKLPAGTRVYATDSVVVRDGDSFAQYPAGAQVVRSASAVTVHDVQSGQTFTFPASATVEYTSGTTKAYVAPGEAVPAWVKTSHGHAIKVL